MQGDHSRMASDGQVERGQVGVSGDDLWIIPKARVIQLSKDAHQAVSPSTGKDGPSLRIVNRLVQLGRSILVRPGQVAVSPEEVIRNEDGEAHLLESSTADLDALAIGGTGGRDEPDPVAGTQGPGLLPGHRGDRVIRVGLHPSEGRRERGQGEPREHRAATFDQGEASFLKLGVRIGNSTRPMDFALSSEIDPPSHDAYRSALDPTPGSPDDRSRWFAG